MKLLLRIFEMKARAWFERPRRKVAMLAGALLLVLMAFAIVPRMCGGNGNTSLPPTPSIAPTTRPTPVTPSLTPTSSPTPTMPSATLTPTNTYFPPSSHTPTVRTPTLTATPTATPTPSPTFTSTPTATPTTTPTSTSTPTASNTPVPIPTPILLIPEGGAEIDNNLVTFQWSGVLGWGQVFRVIVHYENLNIESPNLTDKEWTATLSDEQAGEYTWQVIVVQGDRTVAGSDERNLWFVPYSSPSTPISTRPSRP